MTDKQLNNLEHYVATVEKKMRELRYLIRVQRRRNAGIEEPDDDTKNS